MPEFEERADQLTLDAIGDTLVDAAVFVNARKKLLATGAKLLVGPRGTGKTHVMRSTYAHTLASTTGPVALYANFNRYLYLEPLLKKSPDALKRFHSWVVAKLMLALYELLKDLGKTDEPLENLEDFPARKTLEDLTRLLERGSGEDLYDLVGQFLTVAQFLAAVQHVIALCGKSRAVFLLDDAALSLTDEYLVAFFEIYRLLKTENTAPKAAVYPGSTQYGPTFHTSHEAEEVPLWLSVEDPDYSKVMGQIGEKRLANEASDGPIAGPDVTEYLKYVAFGVPRAYLRLLRSYKEGRSSHQTQSLNKVVEDDVALIGAEYDSLAIKLPQFQSVIKAGRQFFANVVAAVAANQGKDSTATTRNIYLGLRQDDARTTAANRMLQFLVEVGMLYPMSAVSHGPSRKYDRYIPHLAFLQQEGAFRPGRGSSAKDIPNYMAKPQEKHPIRRDLSTLLSEVQLAELKLNLPPCANCGAQRINESQLFCAQCGKELVKASLFEQCMQLPLKEVPGISEAMLRRIHEHTKIRTIGDLHASQNPSAELQKADQIGPIRAEIIMASVNARVEEFLS